MSLRVPFMTLAPGEDAGAVREAIDRVLTRGWFILGPELEAFEAEFAEAAGAGHCVGVGTGTDALALALRAMGIGPGDEVITSPLSAAYSALAIMMAGATPVFADIDPERLTMAPDATLAAVTSAHRGDHAGASLRAARGHAGAGRDRRPPQPGHPRGRVPGALRDVRRPPGRHRGDSPAPSASIPRRTSARSAMRER